MRLAFIANGLSYGGAEKVLAFIATELHKRGHEIAIFNIRQHHGTTQVLPPTISVFNANVDTRNKKLAHIQRLIFCIKSAFKYKPEVLVSFLVFPNLYNVITSKVLSIPSVISERADPFQANRNNNKFEKIIFKMISSATGAVFQTTGASLYYPQTLRERSIVIPNPISITKEFNKVDFFKREKIVVSLGRLDNYQKRIDVLINAFEKFHTYHPQYVLHIYGSGPDKESLEAYIKQKKMKEYIYLMGVSKNSFEDISKGKIFALTSDYEGISNSLLEAMAIGMPVVSTDHSPGGARFLITHGVNGLLTPVGDSNAFASALCCFADDENFAFACGQKATEVLLKFSPNNIIDKWENYLRHFI